jgi:hypothetical protein
MTRLLVLILLVALFCSCGQKQTDSVPENNSSSSLISAKVPAYIPGRVADLPDIVREKSLRNATEVEEFRFYYFPLFSSNKFFKLNFRDSILTVKEFLTKKPDGSGSDTLLNSKNVKFSSHDFKTFHTLIDKSLFWALDSNLFRLSIDGESYVYECRQVTHQDIGKAQNSYHIVRCSSPTNSDFVNLGQFFLFKSGSKNKYSDKHWY